MTSIVKPCPMCDGHPEQYSNSLACWNCRPRRGHPYHVAGYVLRGRPMAAFTPGEIAVDVYHCDRYFVLPTPKRRGVLSRSRRLSDGLESDDYQGQARYVSPEEFTDPETWRLPTTDHSQRRATANASQSVLL